MRFRKFLFTFLKVIVFGNTILVAQTQAPPFNMYLNHPWVDSVMKSLTPDERIAQCIWLAGWSDKGISHEAELAETIKKYKPGGILFFQGTAEKQSELMNYYQKISKTPLIFSMDAEWGIGMRLTGIDKFPYQMALGAIGDDSLIYKMGLAVASQCRIAGIQMNLAPVADINNNPLNPVINYRSFGEEKDNVSAKTGMYMRGMQDGGVLATAKHFPGHGDTDVDSHYNLPVLKHGYDRLDSMELYPFKQLINNGIGAVMSAHLNLPDIDTTYNIPASMSEVILKGILRKDLGFTGIVISDAMNMQGVTKFFNPGEADAMALAAGNDVIEYINDIGITISEVNKLISTGKLTRAEIDEKCRKVLALKYWSGLSKPFTISPLNLSAKINDGRTKALISELHASSLTLLKNDNNIIPVRNLDKKRVAVLAINRQEETILQRRVADYTRSDNFFVNSTDKASVNTIISKLKGYGLVIAGVYNLDQRPARNFGITPELSDLVSRLADSCSMAFVWLGNPYGIDKIKELSDAEGLILTYQENDLCEDLSAQLIFGAIGAKGSLPVTINEKWPAGYGLVTPGNLRMQYGLPESAGVSSSLLSKKVDSLAESGIAASAYPGCEVMIARKGIVIYRKTYGYHTYENRNILKDGDIFDLASVTKVTSTLPGLMLLESEGKFSTTSTLGSLLPYFAKSDKGEIRMDEILTHQAGFTAWIPFWKETVKKDGSFKRSVFSPEIEKKYTIKVADGVYIRNSYRKTIFKEIKKSPVGEKKYLYSDLGFIISPQIIESLSGEEWTGYVTERIFHKIGAFDLLFNPLGRYPESRIVPTEYDSLFRKQLLHGTVHDEGAAMLGGVSGHAGLFATANDLMKMIEMYRRFGNYGGEEIIEEEVIKKYSSVQFPENENRRGLGFDKPALDNAKRSAKDAYPCKGVSPGSFGHYGYTGTFFWVDPENEISYLFLCNRVYPTRNNNLLSEMNIRTNILQAIYDSIE